MNRRNFFSGALVTLSALPGLRWLVSRPERDHQFANNILNPGRLTDDGHVMTYFEKCVNQDGKRHFRFRVFAPTYSECTDARVEAAEIMKSILMESGTLIPQGERGITWGETDRAFVMEAVGNASRCWNNGVFDSDIAIDIGERILRHFSQH